MQHTFASLNKHFTAQTNVAHLKLIFHKRWRQLCRHRDGRFLVLGSEIKNTGLLDQSWRTYGDHKSYTTYISIPAYPGKPSGRDSVRQRGILISAGERPCWGAADTDIPSANQERSSTQQDSGSLEVLSSPWPSSDEKWRSMSLLPRGPRLPPCTG